MVQKEVQYMRYNYVVPPPSSHFSLLPSSPITLLMMYMNRLDRKASSSRFEKYGEVLDSPSKATKAMPRLAYSWMDEGYNGN